MAASPNYGHWVWLLNGQSGCNCEPFFGREQSFCFNDLQPQNIDFVTPYGSHICCFFSCFFFFNECYHLPWWRLTLVLIIWLKRLNQEGSDHLLVSSFFPAEWYCVFSKTDTQHYLWNTSTLPELGVTATVLGFILFFFFFFLRLFFLNSHKPLPEIIRRQW